MEINRIYNSDCIEGLKTLPDNYVDCCITSPPYWGLRDYGRGGQIGLEESPDAFVSKMVDVFTEVKRVLKPTGTLWLNLGDSYAGGGKKGEREGDKQNTNKGGCYVGNDALATLKNNIPGIKNKDLVGIPWMTAFALRSIGYYLRQDIIWHKPNPMPESVTDRCTKAHEYIFLLSKSQKYYYDAESIKKPLVRTDEIQTFGGKKARESEILPNDPRYRNGSEQWGRTYATGKYKNLKDKGQQNHSMHEARANGDEWESDDGRANKRSVWTVTTKPFSDAHFATFPEDLIVDMIKAGCPENGLVLDPFMGAGTTALVSSKLNRNFIGFELNEDYIKIANKRLRDQLGMFNPSNA